MSQGYSKNKLFQIGKDNYRALSGYCDVLLQEGYWEKPESILKHTIFDMLDLYIQSVLIELADACNCFHTEERRYITEIPLHNMIGMNEEVLQEELVSQAQKVLKAPPILLQLCSLRDIEHSSSIAGMFFDALLNILLAMAYLNDSKNVKLTGFILGYYKQVGAFFKTCCKLNYTIDERYVFRKISSDVLDLNSELPAAASLTSEGDFERSKDKFFLYKDRGKRADTEADDSGRQQQEDTADAETGLQDEQDGGGRLEALLEELNGLIGLDSVKTEINSLINMIKVRKLREEYNMPAMDFSYHMVYAGNPGTGKTTVARLVAQIYKELGILTEGNLVETDRSGLVAGYVGQTALKVKEVAESAIGGILFIDEAYSLANNAGNNDFGAETIDTLVKIMEDNRDNLVIIVAGYRDEMQRFLKSNTGLISRFNKFIDFPDYTEKELLLILDSMAGKAGYTIEKKAMRALKGKLSGIYGSSPHGMSEEKSREFGNARGIRNIFEKMVVNQANRVVAYEKPTKEQLTEILTVDTVNIL